jgi:hypothetical protein
MGLDGRQARKEKNKILLLQNLYIIGGMGNLLAGAGAGWIGNWKGACWRSM